MRLHEHRDDVVLGEGVLLMPLLASVLVLLLVLGLEFLCAAAVVTRKPADIRVEVPHVAQQFFNSILGHVGEFLGLSIFVEFDDCDDGHVVEIENAVDLDPLQADEMVVAGVGGYQLTPDVLRYEVILVLF